MSFKIGDEVVYVGGGINPFMSYPEPHKEIVIIDSICEIVEDSYNIKGYMYAKNGMTQSFHVSHLRKATESFTNEITKELANAPEKQVPNKIERVPEEISA